MGGGEGRRAGGAVESPRLSGTAARPGRRIGKQGEIRYCCMAGLIIETTTKTY